MAASLLSDGTPLASQWPIPPKHFFDYELQLPMDRQEPTSITPM